MYPNAATVENSMEVPLKKKENLKIELPYDLQSHFWACYQEKNMIPKDPCTAMFIAAVFTIART